MGVRDLPNVPLGLLLVRPEELAALRRDPEWCAGVDVKRLFNAAPACLRAPLIPDPPRFPDVNVEMQKAAVLAEREACARLAESQGQGVLAEAIRQRGRVNP